MTKASLRKAYGDALVELGFEDENVVVLEADLGKSTMSIFFQEKFPERFFEMGIAEQNMLSTAAGLSLAGKKPFVSSFAVFSTGRAFDQIRQTISIGNLNVNICGSSAGLSDFGDGSTHQSVEDMAIMRAIPNMTVLVPADAVQTRQAVRTAANHQGPVYIRINRNDLPVLTKEDDAFTLGGSSVLREGSDVAIFANGVTLGMALEAADQLEKDGISAEVVNVYSVKPLDCEGILRSARKCGAVVTAEEHSLIGGLGSAITECLSLEKIPVSMVGIKDSFGLSAHGYEELLEYFDLTSKSIVRSVRTALQRK